MPWSETSTMDQKKLFINDYIRGNFAMTELCRRYGISRPTGYKWVDRFEVHGRRVSRSSRGARVAARTRPPSRSPRPFSNCDAGTRIGALRSCSPS